jgi:hypothetical protein
MLIVCSFCYQLISFDEYFALCANLKWEFIISLSLPCFVFVSFSPSMVHFFLSIAVNSNEKIFIMSCKISLEFSSL